MSSKHKQPKDQTMIFRVPKAAVESLDALAKLTGVNRSEALRRLIPDLSANRIRFTGEQTTPTTPLMSRGRKEAAGCSP